MSKKCTQSLNLSLFIFIFFGIFFEPKITFAQDTYVPINSDEYHWVEKAESKINYLIPFATSIKPFSRKNATLVLNEYKDWRQFDINSNQNIPLTAQLDNLIQKNPEWTQADIEGEYGKKSKKPFLKYFYKTTSNFYEFQNKDLYVSVNPVIYAQAGFEKGANKFPFILSRGGVMRARLWNRIGIYSFLTEHQERMPTYNHEIAEKWGRSFPGNDYHSLNKTSNIYDALIARGYIDFDIIKNKWKLTAGYDRHFIGDGIRSMWLSDFGAAYSFLRFNYSVGKWQYQNLFMELDHDYNGQLDRRIPAKYASMHYLTTQLGDKWQLGLFESTIYNTSNHFKLQNLNPIIGLNTAMQNENSHKSALGVNIKGLLMKGLVFYGQSYFNSIDFKTLADGGWKNQYALQAGLKYYDAFSLSNLDVQIEYNVVRPFTYAGLNSTLTNYSHWNQPLAHPLESGFYEAIMHIKYQPIKQLFLDFRTIYATKSADSIGINNGSSIFQPLVARSHNGNYSLINERNVKNFYTNISAAYEWKPNIYFDAGVNFINRKATFSLSNPNIMMIYAGIRMNMNRRMYDWF